MTPLRAILPVLLLLPACAARSTTAESSILPAAWAGGPFAPVTLRIHPLTHIDPGPILPRGAVADDCTIVLHVELKDRFGDAVKGLGRVSVQLYRPGEGVTPGIETQALVWEIPEMTDPEANSARFDQTVRTYRVPLVAPRWVADHVAPARPDATPWLRLRVTLAIDAATGPDAKFLDDEFILQR